MAPVAKAAFWLRYVLLLIAALSGGLFFYLVLVVGPEADKYLMPVVVCLGWSICLMGLGISYRLIPERLDEQDRFFSRLKKKFGRATAYFWIGFFLAASVILIYLSIRSIFMLNG